MSSSTRAGAGPPRSENDASRGAPPIRGLGRSERAPSAGSVTKVTSSPAEKLALVSGTRQPQRDDVGIACTRGAIQPNTFLADLDLADYGTAIVAGTETVPDATACSVDVGGACDGSR